MNEKPNIMHVIPFDDYDSDDSDDSIRSVHHEKNKRTTIDCATASSPTRSLQNAIISPSVLKHSIIITPPRKKREEKKSKSIRYSSLFSSPSISLSSFDINDNKRLVDGTQRQPRNNQTKRLAITMQDIHQFQRYSNHALHIGSHFLRKESQIIRHELQRIIMMKKQQIENHNNHNNSDLTQFSKNMEFPFCNNNNGLGMVDNQSVKENGKGNKRSLDTSHENDNTYSDKEVILLHKNGRESDNDQKRRKISTEDSSLSVLHESDQLNPVGTRTNMETNHHQRLLLDPTTTSTTTEDHHYILLYQRALRMKNFAIHLKHLKMMQKKSIIMELKKIIIYYTE